MNARVQHDVVIVGAGPVGLFLGCCLQRMGLHVLLMERERMPSRQSRSIGIHPPSLERLAQLGLADAMLEKGARVQTGRVYSRSACVGSLSFAACPPPYPFVLTVPQHETESILESHLLHASGASIERGAEITDIEAASNAVRVVGRRADGSILNATAPLLIGCDGKDSLVRRRAAIRFDGALYADSFVMGDFDDETEWGAEARIFLDDDGFIESFPLPGGIRRWVLRVPSRVGLPQEDAFRTWVQRRTGVPLSGMRRSEITSFGAQRFLAESLYRGRVVLAGDAAHVTSPIGGQGMNLGWLNAWDLALLLRDALRSDDTLKHALQAYDRLARRRARRVIRRAEFNMWIGRGGLPALLRDGIVWLLLHSPAKWLLARVFTMRWM
jgi:2-polyprenyl-6-methoxyphenol hydroxylase-like FAD-dependent oxidoreductase